MLRYVVSSVWLDWMSAARNRKLGEAWYDVVRYRIAQYVGSYSGNNDHRRVSQRRKERFFYPSVNERDPENVWLQSYRRPSPHEGQQPTREG